MEMFRRCLLVACTIALIDYGGAWIWEMPPPWYADIYPSNPHFPAKGHRSYARKTEEVVDDGVCRTDECKRIANFIKNSMNESVDPCDDFYEYTCGKWAISNPIPPYEKSKSMWTVIDNNVRNQIRGILESNIKEDDLLPIKMAKKWYKSCMDTERIEKAGVRPLISVLSRIGGWPMTLEKEEWEENDFTWLKVMKYYLRLGVSDLLQIKVLKGDAEDGKNATLVIYYPDLPYFDSFETFDMDHDALYKEKRYENLIVETAKEVVRERGADVSDEKIAKDVKEMLEFEKKLYDLILQDSKRGNSDEDDDDGDDDAESGDTDVEERKKKKKKKKKSSEEGEDEDEEEGEDEDDDEDEDEEEDTKRKIKRAKKGKKFSHGHKKKASHRLHKRSARKMRKHDHEYVKKTSKYEKDEEDKKLKKEEKEEDESHKKSKEEEEEEKEGSKQEDDQDSEFEPEILELGKDLLNAALEEAQIDLEEISYDIYCPVSPDFAKELLALLEDTPARTVVNYIHWMFLHEMLDHTTSKLKSMKFDIWESHIGITDTEPRWKQCVQSVKMSESISYEYVAKHFPSEAKKMAMDMVSAIQNVIEEDVDASTWMDDEMKTKSKEKLKSMKALIGYPDWYQNVTAVERYYKGLLIGRQYFDNVLAYKKYEKIRNYQQLVPTKDSIDKWFYMSPITLNAMYAFSQNSLTITAADFQAPFFALSHPDALNFGIIGFIIGHEVSHAFGPAGIIMDKNGEDISTDPDIKEEYDKRAMCFVDQYNGYRVKVLGNETIKVNGNRTIEENVADTTGLRSIYRAYEKWLKKNGKPDLKLPGLEKFNEKQLFFLSSAILWCDSMRPEVIKVQMKMDGHSTSQIRVIGTLSNMEGFTEAFECPDGSFMNRATKCNIWK